MAGLGRKVWAADEILAADDLQNYIQDQVVFVFDSAGARTSGILSPSEGMVSYLKDTNLLYVFDGSSWVEVAPDVGTPGTYTKVTTDFKGRVTSGTTLAAADIPSIDASKTTSGTFADARIPNLSTSKITSGTFDSSRISGNFDFDRVIGPGTTDNIAVWANNTFLNKTTSDTMSGSFTATGNITGANTYNQTNTGRAMFVNSAGLYGIGSSSRRFKENIVDADIDTDAVLKIAVRNFTYKKDFDPDDSVQIGVIAEELEDLGLDQFLFYNEDGLVDGVAYEKLALALIPLVQEQQSRLDLLEARLDKLEK